MKQHSNCLQRFLFEEQHIRGEWVHLTETWQQAKAYQNLNSAVENQLGQALAAVALLSATIKFEGSMILQIEGNGALQTLVAQANHLGKIRGLARSSDDIIAGSLAQMMGQGRLVLTIETGNPKPYQGVVLLDGHSLAATLETYFRQSEQLPTRLWLVANSTQAAGLLLQTIPSHADNEKNLSEWQTIEYLANTLSEIELLNLDCESLLHRLFHQYPLRLFAAESIEFACHCSREKTQASLLTLGIEELIELAQKQEMITVDCQFCGQSYAFNQTDIQSLIQNNMKHH